MTGDHPQTAGPASASVASSGGGRPTDAARDVAPHAPGGTDRHADLRARMRGAGLLVGPDAAIVAPRGSGVLGGLPDRVRRAFDVLAAGLGLLVVGIPLALVALAVRLESPGDPIFRQRRVGLDGRAFEVLKLRTMVQGAEQQGAGLAIVAGDARITRLGRILRRTSIDELPQLVNVLRGEMAVVGPRPTVPSQVERYDDRQRERLLVRPGLTGWAQVQGRTTLSWPERIELDRHYVARRTLLLDARILVATVAVVLGGAGVERDGAAWREDAPESMPVPASATGDDHGRSGATAAAREDG